MIKYAVSLVLSVGVFVATLSAHADGSEIKERYKIVSIKRDIARGADIRTVNATMMVDVFTGKNWILDEVKGRWVPVGFHNKLSGTDATLIPKP